MGSRKLGVPCENVAIVSAAVAGLGTICAPSRAPSAFSATQTHMDTQRCSLSLMDVQSHTHTHTGSGGNTLGRVGRRDDEFVDCAAKRDAGVLLCNDFVEQEEELLVSK